MRKAKNRIEGANEEEEEEGDVRTILRWSRTCSSRTLISIVTTILRVTPSLQIANKVAFQSFALFAFAVICSFAFKVFVWVYQQSHRSYW
jgi:hypothetical protein